MTTDESAERARVLNALEDAEHLIALVDGDRDHMNQSDLNCEQTQAVLSRLRYAMKYIRAAEQPAEKTETQKLADMMGRLRDNLYQPTPPPAPEKGETPRLCPTCGFLHDKITCPAEAPHPADADKHSPEAQMTPDALQFWRGHERPTETDGEELRKHPADAGSGEEDLILKSKKLLTSLVFIVRTNVWNTVHELVETTIRLTSDLSAAREQIAEQEKTLKEAYEEMVEYSKEVDSYRAERDALSQEVARLREALQPFEEVFDRYPITTDDSHGIMFSFRDLRRAASLAGRT